MPQNQRLLPDCTQAIHQLLAWGFPSKIKQSIFGNLKQVEYFRSEVDSRKEVKDQGVVLRVGS